MHGNKKKRKSGAEEVLILKLFLRNYEFYFLLFLFLLTFKSLSFKSIFFCRHKQTKTTEVHCTRVYSLQATK